MKDKPIINSLLDTDWYILTMCQLFIHKHPTASGRDAFKCRNPHESLFTAKNPSFATTPYYLDWLEEEIDNYCSLTFTEAELQWLNIHSYLKPDFIDWLADFHPKRKCINIIRKEKGRFEIDIQGTITQQIWFEVPILAMISQIYGSGAIYKTEAEEIGTEKALKNITHIEKFAPDMKIADFGTRRRYSHDWQERMIQMFLDSKVNFIGTSNPYFAMKYNIKPIGTMAHKAICAYQQLKGCHKIDSQATMFQDWSEEYRGELGIALSDTLGFQKFLEDFDLYFAKLFDGARHDSGDPYVWGNTLIGYYKQLGINPLEKTAVFSDGLDFKKAIELYLYFNGKIKVSFGIGTKFSNDVGFIPPQIVIKLIECNRQPVAKLSDDPGKTMCKDQDYIKYLTSLL